VTVAENQKPAWVQNVSAPNGLTSRRQLSLTLAALGIVYGDIGTSPLYAVRESMLAVAGVGTHAQQTLGVISLIFWSLIIVVSLKYIVFILRADNNGEGGVLALAQLAHRSRRLGRRVKSAIGLAGVLGLALFYGDGLLTPAISVLSAVEGVALGDTTFEPLVLPLTIAILVGLFVIQSRGTAHVGRLFGPVMIFWFLVLGILGALSIARAPEILFALNPYYSIALVAASPSVGFVALGAVFLAVTGAEALYADMGHLGKRAIRVAWLWFVLPALVLNYFGQGAAILKDPKQIESAFYSVAPQWAHYPMVLLATVATIIASQAVISGVFSITQQAVQLGQLPRMEIRHTSATEYGQIYVPRMNWLLLFGVVLIVLIFRTSGALAHAYGIAVSGQMIISTALVALVARRQWNWSARIVLPLFGSFLILDMLFFSANALKFVDGGWFPILVAVGVAIFMNTWRAGRRLLAEKTYGGGLSIERFLERAEITPIRVSGTAIFITPRPDEVPGSLLHNLKHNHVLHERVILLRVDVKDVPFVPIENRLNVKRLGKGFYAVKIHYGFFETADVPAALERAAAHGLTFDLDTTTFFVRHETLVPARISAMANWQRNLFIKIYASAQQAAEFYRLPPGRVVELGSQTEI
jgi:KUP system potassium uptake protein